MIIIFDYSNGSPERFMDQMHGKLGRHEKYELVREIQFYFIMP